VVRAGEEPFVELNNAQRLAALHATGLLDSPSEEGFDRITRLARRILGTPYALLTLVDDSRQFFKSQSGIPADLAQARGTPLSHAICKHVVEDEQPLIISNTHSNARVRENGAVVDLDITAYAGYPLKTDSGAIIGSFCVLDTEEHVWSEEDLQCLQDLAAMVMTEIELRMALDKERRLRQENDQIARTLQAALLPPILPHVEGVDISTAYLPQGAGNLVGGDFYDIFESADTRSHIVLGDVCGKGFVAARTSLLVRHVVRAAALHGDDSFATFRLVDEALKQQNNPFVAAEIVVVSKNGDNLVCDITIAGQPLPLLLRSGKVEVVGEYGTVLGAGIEGDLKFGSVQCVLAPGDIVMLYTDGVTDNPVDSVTEYDLRDALNAQPPTTTREAVDSLVAIAHNAGGTQRPPKDDIAIVAIGNPTD
jgi:sigma-B regulation protein RsbU (phosphoserine phosphatase)